jgi:PIN domain nuclease of toxin-antitoxin system
LKLLLDTHVLVWAATASERLGPKALASLRTGECSLSTISAHELVRLVAGARLEFGMPIAAWLAAACAQLRVDWAPVHVAEAIESYSLPNFDHRDPCDRLIVATARIGAHVLMTADDVLLDYKGVRTIDARL